MGNYAGSKEIGSATAEEENFIRVRWTDGPGVFQAFPQAAQAVFPDGETARVARFVREQDRASRYAAAGLVATLLADYFPNALKAGIERDTSGRPCLTGIGRADLSISHSGEIVVAAVSAYGRIGIDVEEIRPLDTTDFESVFPESLWRWFRRSEHDPENGRIADERFFHAWTWLESVVKADGRGLLAPVRDIVFDDTTAVLGDTVWHRDIVSLYDGYVCSLSRENGCVPCEAEYVGGVDLKERCRMLS